MHAALETVQRALELNSSSTDCWNLLALITSVQTAGTAKALQIAADALDGHAVCAPSSDDNVSITAPAEASTFAALRAVIQLRITRIALIESIEGPQTALAYFKDLYTSFAHDFAPFLRGSGDSSLVSDGITAAPESHRSHQLHTVIDSLKVPKRKWSLKSRRSRKTSNNSLAPSTTASSENISLMDSSAPATPVRPSSIGNGSAAAAATAIADIRGRASSSGSSGSTASTGALSQYRQRQAKKLAQVLWLQTAATFRRAGDIEQAREAIWEAEKIDAEYPDVWVQLGLLHARQEHADTAIECMEKALAFSPDHVPALVHLARLLMVKPAREQEQWLDIAVGLMEECSELRGWRSAEVWLTLGEAYERQGRTESARAAILKALELEEGKPIRPFELALPRTL